MHLKIRGNKDGRDVPVPQDLDAIVIETSKGGILIDLGGQIPDMVMLRATWTEVEQRGDVRLILSPMASGRMAVGVIRT